MDLVTLSYAPESFWEYTNDINNKTLKLQLVKVVNIKIKGREQRAYIYIYIKGRVE